MNGYDAYAATNSLIDDDDKPKVLLKVYRALIDKHEVVKTAMKEKDYRKKYEELSKITMVLELMNHSLDMSQGEIPRNLSSIYTYLIKRLNEVHTTLNPNTVTESEELIKKMLEGFTSAAENLKHQDRKATVRSKV